MFVFPGESQNSLGWKETLKVICSKEILLHRSIRFLRAASSWFLSISKDVNSHTLSQLLVAMFDQPHKRNFSSNLIEVFHSTTGPFTTHFSILSMPSNYKLETAGGFPLCLPYSRLKPALGTSFGPASALMVALHWTACRVPVGVPYAVSQPLPWMCCCTGSNAPSPCSSSTAARSATDFSRLLKPSWELLLRKGWWREMSWLKTRRTTILSWVYIFMHLTFLMWLIF